MAATHVVTALADAGVTVRANEALGSDRSMLDRLRESSILASLSKREMEHLVSRSSVASFDEGSVVSPQDAPVTHVLFVLDGRAKAELSSPARSAFRAVLSFLGPGDAIGLLSIVDGATHSASVVALTPVNVLSVPIDVLKERFEEHADWHEELLRVAVSRARVGNEWLQALI